MKLIKGIALVSAAGLLAACGSDDDDSGVSYPSTYQFESKVDAGESSVKFTGQATRQLLISEMKKAVKDAEVTNAELLSIFTDGTTALSSDVTGDIYGTGSGIGADVNVSAPDDFTLVQPDYGTIFNGENNDSSKAAGAVALDNKMAGCDNPLNNDQFIGWDMTGLLQECGQGFEEPAVLNGNDAPYSLMRAWITAAEDGYVDTSLGLDYAQLFQKFLLGAVTYSQTAQDYLKADKGLEKDNDELSAGNNTYTPLEHQWDEGFGYFGASLGYLNIADATINGGTYHDDVNGDTAIDLLFGEYNSGLAVYASKHDVMTKTTDLSNDIMSALLEGRQIIQNNFGTNPVNGEGYHVQLEAASDRVVAGMEKVLAVSVVKYINQTIDSLDAYVVGSEENSLTLLKNIAKYWSELKGFALGLQFAPTEKMTMTEAQQIDLHVKIGQSPIQKLEVEHGDKAAYIAELEAARTAVQEAFGFDAEAVTQWGRPDPQ